MKKVECIITIALIGTLFFAGTVSFTACRKTEKESFYHDKDCEKYINNRIRDNLSKVCLKAFEDTGVLVEDFFITVENDIAIFCVLTDQDNYIKYSIRCSKYQNFLGKNILNESFEKYDEINIFLKGCDARVSFKGKQIFLSL